jgi:hypothetical protein
VKLAGTTVADTVSCDGVRSQSCTVTETLTVVETVAGKTVTAVAARADKKAKPKQKTVVVGSNTLKVTGGQSETVKVTLNGTGTALLRKRGKLPVAVTVKQGSRTLRSQHVMFSAPKKRL